MSYWTRIKRWRQTIREWLDAPPDAFHYPIPTKPVESRAEGFRLYVVFLFLVVAAAIAADLVVGVITSYVLGDPRLGIALGVFGFLTSVILLHFLLNYAYLPRCLKFPKGQRARGIILAVFFAIASSLSVGSYYWPAPHLADGLHEIGAVPEPVENRQVHFAYYAADTDSGSGYWIGEFKVRKHATDGLNIVLRFSEPVSATDIRYSLAPSLQRRELTRAPAEQIFQDSSREVVIFRTSDFSVFDGYNLYLAVETQPHVVLAQCSFSDFFGDHLWCTDRRVDAEIVR